MECLEHDLKYSFEIDIGYLHTGLKEGLIVMWNFCSLTIRFQISRNRSLKVCENVFYGFLPTIKLLKIQIIVWFHGKDKINKMMNAADHSQLPQ